MIVLLILVFIGIVFIEVPGLIKNKHWHELMAFSFFFVVAFIMTLLQTFGVKLPSPINLMTHIIKDILHLNYG